MPYDSYSKVTHRIFLTLTHSHELSLIVYQKELDSVSISGLSNFARHSALQRLTLQYINPRDKLNLLKSAREYAGSRKKGPAHNPGKKRLEDAYHLSQSFCYLPALSIDIIHLALI